MMANCFLLLACLLFSFACNLIKKLYDDKDYSTVLEMLKSAAVSCVAGFIFAMILSEFFSSPLIVVSLSGIGGFFGMKALNALIRTNISTKLTATEALQELLANTTTNDTELSKPVDTSSQNKPTENNNAVDANLNAISNTANYFYLSNNFSNNNGEDGTSKHIQIRVIKKD